MAEYQAFLKEVKRGITHLKKHDKRLANVIERSPEFRIKKSSKHLELLAASVISQQLSGKVADKIYDRMMDYFKGKLSVPGILETSEETFRSFGLSFAKIACLKDIAVRIDSGELNFRKMIKKPDSELTTELVKVKGIGEWTAQMYLMFGLARLDVLPVNDYGVRKAIMNLYSLKKMPDPEKIHSISTKNNWAPYRTIASWYLWRSLENGEKE